ncbi:MAG: double-strand break repair protein AddB, partial [Bdellovibrionales bacterium]
DCEHHREEADVIALRLRAVLEEDGKTAALVTPDRALAARVSAALGRWGIVANDSAGTPLSAWPVGSFLIHLLQAAAPDASPVDFLSFLKHPLAAVGGEPAECRRLARLAEVAVWRGVRRAGGWRGAAAALQAERPALAAWVEGIGNRFEIFSAGWGKVRPLVEWIDAHLALAEAMAATIEGTGAARLWVGAAGEAAVAWLDEWRQASRDFPGVTGAAYAALFEAMCGDVPVRPAYGAHPRLSILGPLEARLLHHDVVILGGLNEGTWPPAPAVDPWLSRPMKRDFGLPLPERRVGQSAHDFVQMVCSPTVVLTRAGRVGGSPSVPSRFLMQIETVRQAAALELGPNDAQAWRSWARLLDQPDGSTTMDPPRPCPPVAARPTSLRVTEISTWVRNPYAIYARHVLKLNALEPIDADVTAAEHGTAIHAALESFVRASMQGWPELPLAGLLEEGRKAFAPFMDRPQVAAFWWPRFERIAQWFVAFEEERRARGVRPLAVEGAGEMVVADGALKLRGRLDRVDALPEGGVEIIDYKTGGVPAKGEVLAGIEPQLPLLALMVQAGCVQGVRAQEVTALSYWKLQEKDEKKKITTYADDLDGQGQKAQDGLAALCRAFADPATPYEVAPKPKWTPRFDDYAHLARMAEWGRVKEGES